MIQQMNDTVQFIVDLELISNFHVKLLLADDEVENVMLRLMLIKPFYSLSLSLSLYLSASFSGTKVTHVDTVQGVNHFVLIKLIFVQVLIQKYFKLISLNECQITKYMERIQNFDHIF